MRENLWMNMTDGAILCGRRYFDGSGGNNHAVEHYRETGYPLAVKLGTITPDGAGKRDRKELRGFLCLVSGLPLPSGQLPPVLHLMATEKWVSHSGVKTVCFVFLSWCSTVSCESGRPCFESHFYHELTCWPSASRSLSQLRPSICHMRTITRLPYRVIVRITRR